MTHSLRVNAQDLLVEVEKLKYVKALAYLSCMPDSVVRDVQSILRDRQETVEMLTLREMVIADDGPKGLFESALSIVGLASAHTKKAKIGRFLLGTLMWATGNGEAAKAPSNDDDGYNVFGKALARILPEKWGNRVDDAAAMVKEANQEGSLDDKLRDVQHELVDAYAAKLVQQLAAKYDAN